MAPDNERLEIITYATGADLDHCQRLCESIDRFVPARIRHTLVVPPKEHARFVSLRNGRRTVLTTRDALPGRFRQLPVGDDMWIDGNGWPVRGWIIRQLVKLSANRFTDAELLLFAGPDLQFLPSFDAGAIYRYGKLRLHRVRDEMNAGRRWHTRAWTLLGEDRDCFRSDYGGQLISWRRSCLVSLQRHVETIQGCPWFVAVPRNLDVSAYALYGAFVEYVLGDRLNGHFYEGHELCHSCLFDYQAQDLIDGRSALAPGTLALQLESGLSLGPAAERTAFETAVEHTGTVRTGLGP